MFYPGKTGKCPYCGITVRFEVVNIAYGEEDARVSTIEFIAPLYRSRLEVAPAACPECKQCILVLTKIVNSLLEGRPMEQVLWPDSIFRPVPSEVEAEAPTLAADFQEAVAVLQKSKKASAALSRRCLQYILREKGGAKPGKLSHEIQHVINKLPPALAENVAAIGKVGDFAAHPMKDTKGSVTEKGEKPR